MTDRHKPGRPNSVARGYGKAHMDMRKYWLPYVRAGVVDCKAPLCTVETVTGSRRIARDAKWDLGHDETDRRKYLGPMHETCNRGAARRAARKALPPVDPPAAFDENQWT